MRSHSLILWALGDTDNDSATDDFYSAPPQPWRAARDGAKVTRADNCYCGTGGAGWSAVLALLFD